MRNQIKSLKTYGVSYLFSTLFFTLYFNFSNAQTPLAKVGDKVPSVNITDYIVNAPNDKNFDNKFKVIEFWATWCGPCLAAVPHLNELNKRFKDRSDLVFLSITDEPVEKAKKIANKIHFETIVVSDRTQKTHEIFIKEKDGTYSIPRTILVDNQNIVRWVGSPNELTEAIINAFINKQEISTNVSKSEIAPKKVESKTEDNTLYYEIEAIYKNKTINTASIFKKYAPEEKVPSAGSFWDEEVGNFMLFGFKAKEILANVTGISISKIIIPEEDKNSFYNFIYKSDPEDFKKHGNKPVTSYLLDRLNYKEETVMIETDVYLLKVKDTNTLQKTANNEGKVTSHSGFSKIHYSFDNVKLSRLAGSLSEYFEIFIFDETNNQGRYNFLIKKGSLENLIAELNENGLTLEKSKKTIQFHKYTKVND